MLSDWSGSVLAWEEELGRLKTRMGGVFSRLEVGRTAGAFHRRPSFWRGAQDRLADGRTGRVRRPVSHAVASGTQFVVGGRIARCGPGLCVWSAWRSGWRAGRRRDRILEEGRALGRGGAAIFGNSRPDREFAGGRFSGIAT